MSSLTEKSDSGLTTFLFFAILWLAIGWLFHGESVTSALSFLLYAWGSQVFAIVCAIPVLGWILFIVWFLEPNLIVNWFPALDNSHITAVGVRMGAQLLAVIMAVVVVAIILALIFLRDSKTETLI